VLKLEANFGRKILPKQKIFSIYFFIFVFFFTLLPLTTANAASGNLDNPAIRVLLSLAILLFVAKLGGDIAVRFKQPEVLGELLIGVLLGNLALLGLTYFDYLKHDVAIEILSEIGVVLLLFEVGLETKLGEMRRVGLSSLFVALLGVTVPFFLGWGVGVLFLPQADTLVHVFLGATLTATSVGITARVLKDIRKLDCAESRIILGAAVIDDVLGLIILAIVSGIITGAQSGEAMNVADIAKIALLAFGFLFGAIFLGRYLSPLCFRFAAKLRSHGVLLATGLVFCFGLSYLAALLQLAPIVGAFAAGLILEPTHYRELARRENDITIEKLLAPLTAVFVPIFFVTMGTKVDLRQFADPSIWQFAAVLTLAAIIGKQVCSLGVLEKGLDKLIVGIGMIPRGEVGLIFASIGAKLMIDGQPVIDQSTFGAVVFMVIFTTMLTPPLIIWRFNRNKT